MSPLIRHHLRKSWPSLDRHGVAVEHFPAYRGEVARIQQHQHDVFYASLLVQGRCWHRIADEVTVEEPGCLSIVRPGIPHLIDTHGETVDVYNVYFDPERHPLPRIEQRLSRLVDRLIVQGHSFDRRTRLQRVRFADAGRLVALLDRIRIDQDGPVLGRSDLLRAHLMVFQILLARQLDQSGLAALPDQNPRLEAAIAWMCGHLADDQRCAEAASVAGFSRSYFSRSFLAYTGCSPRAWLMDRRTREAACLLRGSDESIAAIAASCGFKSLSHFTRRFRTMFGRSPQTWRAQQG